MVSRGWNFCLGSLQKLLVSLVDKAGDFTANLDARLGKETRATIVCPFNRRGDANLFEEDAVLCAGSFQDVKSVFAKPGHGFFIRTFFSSGCHKVTCRRFDSGRKHTVAREADESILSHIWSISSNITVVQRITPYLRSGICLEQSGQLCLVQTMPSNVPTQRYLA